LRTYFDMSYELKLHKHT